MAVSAEYREFVLEQLARVEPVTSRSMFGGVGIYSRGLFFALIAGDAVYLKVDDTNRADFEAAGMGPFRPFGGDKPMHYYELPAELLEEPDRLRPWMHKALEVARRKRRGQ
ncbi:MAG TPA: TfoX/Sxy family protein [Longimicrobium sp.]|jgi:DNA transformation protein